MKIALLGAGRMGSWLVRELSPEHTVAIHDRNPEKNVQVVGTVGNIRIIADLAALRSFAPDMLINAVSLRETVTAFREVDPHLPNGCILCDVASVKTGLPAYYKEQGRPFVSLHPMFGPTFADMNALRKENVVLIRESDPGAAGFFCDRFRRLGLNIFEYTFEEHDGMMAYSLTIPFVSSLVFAACVDATAVPGTTFSRHIAIARGLLSEDSHLLAEILFNPNSIGKIENITSRLEYLKHIIRARDPEEMEKFLDELREHVSSSPGPSASY